MSSRVCQARTIGHQYSIPSPRLAVEWSSAACSVMAQGLETISSVFRFKRTLRTHMPWGPKWGPGEFESYQNLFSRGDFNPILKRKKKRQHHL